MTGVGFAPGTTVGEIVDDQTIVVSNPCTVSSPSYASLAFSLPHAIPLNGQLLFSPCVLLNDVHADMYRSCGGDSPGWGGVTAVEPSWLDVSSRFAAFSFSWEINNSLTTASSLASSGTAAGVDFVDSDDSSSTLTVAGSGAIVAAVAAPSKPLFTPVAPPTGQFRVYKCKTCCETCFYLILFKAPTGFFLGAPTVTDRISANGTLAVTGTYSRTVIQAATPHGGGTTVTTTTVFSQTVGGTIAAQGFGTYFDYGLSCYPKGQSGINPQQGYGVVGGSIGELSRSLTSTGTETVTVSSGGGGSGPNPWSGPLILSLASISNGAGMTIDSCHPTGTHTINTTTTVKTVVATTSSGVTTTVTTTMDSDPPVITTTTVAGSHTAVGTTTTTQVTQTAITIGIA
jgi:hypothetical protein